MRAYRKAKEWSSDFAEADQAIQALVKGLERFGWRLVAPTAVQLAEDVQSMVVELTEEPLAQIWALATKRMQHMQNKFVETQWAARGIV